MRSLFWSETSGNVCWWGDASTWIGAWERDSERQGIYVSARQSMVAFVLEGELLVELGPRRLTTSVARGGALVVNERTPFSYTMSSGSRLVVTETALVSSALGARAISPDRLPRRAAAVLARAWNRPDQLAKLGAFASDVARSSSGAVLQFEPVFNTERVLAVKRYLEAHFHEPLRLHAVAARFHMSHFYLSRAFTLTTGISPKVYLSALRREHFLRSLLASERRRSLASLALDAGFDDYAAFCRWTRSHFGRAPSRLLDAGEIDQLCTTRDELGGATLRAQ
jgi:AraC-like DNA-binding protein